MLWTWSRAFHENQEQMLRERERERERHIDIAFCHFLGSSLQMGSPIVGQSGGRHSLCQDFPEKKISWHHFWITILMWLIVNDQKKKKMYTLCESETTSHNLSC